MVLVCVPSDALSQHLPSYFGLAALNSDLCYPLPRETDAFLFGSTSVGGSLKNTSMQKLRVNVELTLHVSLLLKLEL